MNDEKFLLEYEKLLDKGYCDCNEMNCIDNDSPRRILKIAKNLQQENQELKKQLEEINDFINKANFANIEQLMLDYCAKTEEQKEFIDWLENEIENCKYGEENYADGDDMTYHNENELRKEILSKYKEIIGGKDE